MNDCNRLDRFQFHNYRVLNEQIKTESTFQFYVLVDDRNGFFRSDIEASSCEFLNEAISVGGLQLPRAKMPVHLDSRAYDCVG